MVRRVLHLVLSALAGLAPTLTACERAAPAPDTRAAGRLGQVELFRPAAAPRALVYLFSDRDGWSPGWTHAAELLRAHDVAVVGVDLPQYLAGLRASDDGCHYVVAELEDRSQRWQRELGGAVYHSPILAGVGEGGTLALAALAQAPAATVAGAVVADPAPTLATRVPLCPGAPSHPVPEGGFAYGEPSAWPGFVRRAEPGRAPAVERLAMAVVAATDASGAGGGLHDLPLVELPASRPGPFLAVIYSGDGGWRDLDKTVGEWLAANGVAVVGVDSLRYFWNERTPERVAADLAEIIRHYGARWKRSEVALIGYSFGAGIVPFALNRLPELERARVVQISLLGLEPRAPFGFHVAGWLEQVGVLSDVYRDAPLVLPELERIDPRMVQCFAGVEEPDSLCRAPELDGVERITTPGGHHFDGDYPKLARQILDGLERRAAARSAP